MAVLLGMVCVTDFFTLHEISEIVIPATASSTYSVVAALVELSSGICVANSGLAPDTTL